MNTKVEADASKSVNLIVVVNPLQPSESRQVYHKPWTGESLIGYTGELNGQWVIQSSHRGAVEQSQLGGITPQPGEYFVLAPVLGGGGGGGGKDILRMVALIALTVASGGIAAGTWVLPGMTAGAMSAATVGLATAAQVGGTLLLNRLLPVDSAKENTQASAQSYGVDGPKNVSTEGIAFPLVYGEHWVGGNIISLFVDNVGSQQQYLNMLIVLSEGEIESVEEILINDQPLSSYSDVQVVPRFGTDDQTVIPFFNDIVTPVNRNIRVVRNMAASYNQSEAAVQTLLKTSGAESYFGHVTTGPANKLRIDCLFPVGLGVQHNDGDYDQGSSPEDGCNFAIGYRESGTSGDFLPLGAWSTTSTQDTSATSGALTVSGTYDPSTAGYGELEYADETSIGYTTQTGIYPSELKIQARGNSQSAIRRSYFTGELDPTKRYEIRAFNTQDDDVETTRRHRILFVTDINEIQYDDIAYNHTALLGLRIKMNDQLNAIPTVLTRIKGIKCQVYVEETQEFETLWTDNPAWITYDALTKTRYGRGTPPESIKLSYFREWATYCEDNDLTFNGVIAESTNIWDGLKPVLRVGRSRIVRAGTKHQIATQKPKTSQMLFSSGNIRKGSLSVNWSSMDGRANEVHVKYYDKLDQNRPKTIIVQDNVARLRGDDAIKTDLDLRGVDNFAQAAREGAIALNMNKLTQTVSFDAPVESIAITLGDVFSVQQDMSQWGAGGLLGAGSTTSVVNLDKDVTMTSGKSYELLVKHDVILEHTNTIDQILGDTIYFTGAFDPDDHERILRLESVTSGVERSVLGYAWNGVKHGVVVGDASGLGVGHSIRLKDTDVLEFANVVLEVGTTNVVTLAAPLRQAPNQYSGYAFGEIGSVAKQFTCEAISGTGDMWRTITGLEYREDALSDVPIDVTSPDTFAYPRVTNVDLVGWSQTASSLGNPNRIEVSFHWKSDSEIYDKAEVFVVTAASIKSIGTFTDTASVEADEGDVIKVAIVPVDRYGRRPDFSQVTKHEYTVTNQFVLHSPQNLTLTSELALTSTGNYQTNALFAFEAPDDTYHLVSYEVQYQIDRRGVWSPVGNSLKTNYELSTAEIGTLQFRVRSVYVQGEQYSDWAEVEIEILGTYSAIATVGLEDPVNPILHITINPERTTADIRVSVERPGVEEIIPESFVIFYSADDIPNTIQLGADEGAKLRALSVEISGEFELTAIAGSSLTEIRYEDPLDIVDVDLSGLWWVRVESGVSGDTRYFKVAGASTSEFQLAKGDELPYVPVEGDIVRVIEVAWHDSRLPEFRLGWIDGEVINHNGLQFDGSYYIDAPGRGAEGTTQATQSGKTMHYYPALGPDTTSVVIDMADFVFSDGVWSYNGTLDLKIPVDMAWSAVTCCFARKATEANGSAYVRSNILPLTIGGPA